MFRTTRLTKVLFWLRNWFLISIPSIAYFGCQLSWALQGSFVTPQLESLNASEHYISYIWLAGPISGIVLQPLIGLLSDGMSHQQRQKYGGRRRPFIIIGCISIVICLVIFSNAKYITQNILSSNSTLIALIIACISFWILDLSTNIVQAPLRALISDVIPVQYLKYANGLFGFQHSFGAAFAFFLGFSLSSSTSSGGSISLVFGFAAIIIFITGLITFLSTDKNEQLFAIHLGNLSPVSPSAIISDSALMADIPLEEIKIFIDAEDDEKIDEMEIEESILEIQSLNVASSHSSFREMCHIFKNMPKPILCAFVVQFFTYIGLFATQIYLTDWFGREIMGGNPQTSASEKDIELYHSGIKYANIGLFFMAILSMPFSLLLPSLINKYGYRYMYSLCLFLFGVVLISLKFLSKGSIALAIILIACNFPIWSASQIVGWSIVSEVISGDINDRRAIYTTLFNLANCFPEILVAVIGSPIVDSFDGGTGVVLLVAGIFCILGSVFGLCFLIEPKDWLMQRNNQKQKF